MNLKRTPADKYFSDCIRIAANWTCERCGSNFHGPSLGLHCSHWIGRASYPTRFDPLNAFSHCAGCHSLLGGDTPAFYDYAMAELGQVGVDILRARKEDTDLGRAYRKANQGGTKSILAKHYKAEFEHMEKVRNDGYMRKLEFDRWVPEG